MRVAVENYVQDCQRLGQTIVCLMSQVMPVCMSIRIALCVTPPPVIFISQRGLILVSAPRPSLILVLQTIELGHR